jgi:hypothetical protein
LASIKSKKIVEISGKGKGKGEIDTTLIGYKKIGEINGYQTKIVNGEVVFTAKNGLGVNLGGTQYQKQITTKVGYTKSLSNFANQMSGIEIINPKGKKEIYYQKLTGSRGAIEDGNYTVISTNLENFKGLSGSISCRQMKVLNSNIDNNNPEADLGNNGQQKSFRKQIIISSKTQNVTQNDINGQSIPKVILNNSKIKDSKNKSNIYLKQKDSQNSGNNNRIQDSPNSANINYDINQQMNAGKVIFNSRLKTESNHNSPATAGDEIGKIKGNNTSSRIEYEMRIKTSRDGDKKIITENKKVSEIMLKKNKKTKNVEPLRDYDSQNNF